MNPATPLRPFPLRHRRGRHVFRPARVLSSDGPSADENLPPMHPALPRQSSHPVLHLPRPVPMHGICATHLSARACAISKHACGHTATSSITWAFVAGKVWRPSCRHQRRSACTARSAVSWSTPTLTQLPRLRGGAPRPMSRTTCASIWRTSWRSCGCLVMAGIPAGYGCCLAEVRYHIRTTA